MSIASGFIDTLREYGETSDANKARLIAWRDSAIEDVAENKGGHIVSAAANGASFAQMANMTNAEWATACSRALKQINLGFKGGGRVYGNIF